MGVKIGGKPVAKAPSYEDHLTPAKPPQKLVAKHGHSVSELSKGIKGQTDKLVSAEEQDHGVLMYAAEQMGSVTVKGGRTINLGNFESARFDCAITMPCTHETLEDTYGFCVEWVDKKVSQATEQVKG